MVKDESDIQTIRDAAPQSDYDILVVVTDSYSQRGRMRLGTDCRRELALEREYPELAVCDQVILEERLRDLTGCAVQYRYPDELS